MPNAVDLQHAGEPLVLPDGVYVHELLPNGPRLGQFTWDFTALARTAQGERQLHFEDIPHSYLPTIQRVLCVLGRPDHPDIAAKSIVRNANAAPLSTLTDCLTRLRTLSVWGQGRQLHSFQDWSQRDLDDFVEDLRTGNHRAGGKGMTPHSVRGYTTTIKWLYQFADVLPEPFRFAPWPHRTSSKVAGAIKPLENTTSPLPWEAWAPLIAAAWKVIDVLADDILGAHRHLTDTTLSVHLSRGLAGAAGLTHLEQYLADGGTVPLHTGFGRSGSLPRGGVNRSLLQRLTGLSGNLFHPSHHSYRPEAASRISEALEAGQGTYGGLYQPQTRIILPDGSHAPWLGEVGLGEAEYLPSVLRAACYVIIASLSGMRDSELQELRRGCLQVRGELTVLESVQHKGTEITDGQQRLWWVPKPVEQPTRRREDLSEKDLLFARADRGGRHKETPGPYAPQRDIPRLLEFINATPDTRIGRGAPLGLEPVNVPAGQAINATSLRRSFSVHAARYPGAELGLGIQLGHTALRMTSGYVSDGQQQVLKMLDGDRSRVVQAEVHRLMTGQDGLAGQGGEDLASVRARIVTDTQRSADLQHQVAQNYHLGLVNDCRYRPNTAACGADGPHLASSFCAAGDCGNAVVHTHHEPALRAQLVRIDTMLDRPKILSALEARLRAQRTQIVTLLEGLDTAKEEP